MAGCVVFHSNLIHSRHGRALLAVREDEIAAEALGIPTTRYKVAAFVIGAAFAGIAGGLFGHYLMYLNPNSFTLPEVDRDRRSWSSSAAWARSPARSLAAILLTILPEALRAVQRSTGWSSTRCCSSCS